MTLEDSQTPALDFTKLVTIANRGFFVIPAVAQDVDTKEVLIIGYVDEAGLAAMQKTAKLIFFSTSRGEKWVKGASSGQTFTVTEIRVNCEQNSLLLLVKPDKRSGMCHTRDDSGAFRESCFYRRLDEGGLISIS